MVVLGPAAGEKLWCRSCCYIARCCLHEIWAPDVQLKWTASEKDNGEGDEEIPALIVRGPFKA